MHGPSVLVFSAPFQFMIYLHILYCVARKTLYEYDTTPTHRTLYKQCEGRTENNVTDVNSLQAVEQYTVRPCCALHCFHYHVLLQLHIRHRCERCYHFTLLCGFFFTLPILINLVDFIDILQLCFSLGSNVFINIQGFSSRDVKQIIHRLISEKHICKVFVYHTKVQLKLVF